MEIRARYMLNLNELHTILAALRFYQQAGMADQTNRPNWLHEIATNHSEVVSLGPDSIDRLSERLNFESIFESQAFTVVSDKHVGLNLHAALKCHHEGTEKLFRILVFSDGFRFMVLFWPKSDVNEDVLMLDNTSSLHDPDLFDLDKTYDNLLRLHEYATTIGSNGFMFYADGPIVDGLKVYDWD